MKTYFGIDLGGTSAKLAVIDEKNRILKVDSISTNGFPNPHELAREMGFLFRQMTASLKGRRPRRIGVGVAGDIDSLRGVVRISPNLGWKNVPLGRFLKNETGVESIVDNDANAAAWGIFKTEAPRGVKNMLAVTLGTGVGGGIILDGKLYQGATGSAGEWGHMVMNENGRRCNCGLQGCLETYAGGTHIVRTVQEALAVGQASSLSSLFHKDRYLITPKSIADAASKKDPYALSVWNQVGHVLGVGLGNLIYILNPEMIYLTGGVSLANRLIMKPLMKSLSQRPFKTPVRHVRVRIAKNPANAGVIGASLL